MMMKQTRATTLWNGKSASTVATLYYPKCPLFNKKLWDIQRNRKVWPIHRGKNQKVEIALKDTDGALSRQGLQSIDNLLFLFSHLWCLTLCNPMEFSTPGFNVLYHLLALALMHVHWISDAIQPSHPLSFPSPPAFNLSQHRGLF